jgi:hypothetical protein
MSAKTVTLSSLVKFSGTFVDVAASVAAFREYLESVKEESEKTAAANAELDVFIGDALDSILGESAGFRVNMSLAVAKVAGMIASMGVEVNSNTLKRVGEYMEENSCDAIGKNLPAEDKKYHIRRGPGGGIARWDLIVEAGGLQALKAGK